MHENADILEKLCIFYKLFVVSWMLFQTFFMISVQEDLRNNK